MSRLDEIKKRVASAATEGVGSSAWEAIEVEAYRDITFLLAQLERAERTFSKIEELTASLEEKTNGVFRGNINLIGQVARVARQKIHEDQ